MEESPPDEETSLAAEEDQQECISSIKHYQMLKATFLSVVLNFNHKLPCSIACKVLGLMLSPILLIRWLEKAILLSSRRARLSVGTLKS